MTRQGPAEPVTNRRDPAPSRGSYAALRRLLPYLARHRGLVAGAVFFLLLASATTLSLPLAVRRVVDLGFGHEDGGLVNAYFAMLVVIALVLALASAGRYFFVITLGERLVADLRKDVFARVVDLSPAFFDRTLSGEIVSRLTADTTQIKSAVGASASLALRNAILFVGALAMMIVTAPGLSLIVIAAIPFVVLPLVAIGRSVRRRSRAAQDRLAEATAYAGEAISSVRTVQAFNAEATVRNRFMGAVDEAYEAARASVTARAFLTALAIFTILASVVLVLWIGASQVIEGTMSAGTLGQFLLYAVFAAGGLGQLSEVFGELNQAAGATERLIEILAEPDGLPVAAVPALLPTPPRGTLAFEGVSFAYPGRPGRGVLDDVSFEVRAGETVAIVGTSGAGKSTLFALAERFYDPTAGRILVDGVDARDVDPQALRRRFAFVPQDVAIFAASLRDNLVLGAPDADDAAVRAAVQAANAQDFIAALDDGVDTVVGERGMTLSGGQRQRIAIARALLRDAPILLLDEATSALDAESEALVQSALETLMAGRTTLVIAHRLATILKADRILVLSEGRIVEEGNHKSLTAAGGIYARLARLQFENAYAKAAE